jgi:hypothetical protein
MMKQILNLDEECMLLDGGNGNQGGRPTVTYYDVCFPQLGKATSKSELTTTMIGRSNAAGEPIPPHFQFQTSAKTPDAEALHIECIHYMLNVQAVFGHEEVQSFLRQQVATQRRSRQQTRPSSSVGTNIQRQPV